MKKNKQKIIMIFLSVLLLITLFPFSVFANGELPVYSSTPSKTDLLTSPVYRSTDSSNSRLYAASSNENVDYFYYLRSNVYYYYLASTVSNYTVYSVTASNNDTVYTRNLSWNSSYGCYYASLGNNNANYLDTTFIYLGEFSSDNEAFAYYVSNGVNYGPDPVKYPYTFQNGYLFVYDLGQSNTMYSFDLQSKSEEYSSIGSIPFPDTNQCYWFDNSLPEIDETNIPSSSAINIDWSKGNKTNIFGQTQDMVATISGTSSGRYLYVYNPPVHYKWSGSSNPTASEVVNYPVTIDGVYSGDNFYIYDSFARLSDFNQGGKVTGTITGTTGYGSVSTDGAITVTTSEGAIYNQTSGGSTDISGANGGSLAENINGLKETLDNFLNQFVQLLSAPISHIRQLISASQEFLSEFSHFFDWLPSEVSGFVISAFIVMVAIGIFKLFL